jgi:hypothetical protein
MQCQKIPLIIISAKHECMAIRLNRMQNVSNRDCKTLLQDRREDGNHKKSVLRKEDFNVTKHPAG